MHPMYCFTTHKTRLEPFWLQKWSYYEISNSTPGRAIFGSGSGTKIMAPHPEPKNGPNQLSGLVRNVTYFFRIRYLHCCKWVQYGSPTTMWSHVEKWCPLYRFLLQSCYVCTLPEAIDSLGCTHNSSHVPQ